MDFHADNPNRTYPQTVQVASRIENKESGCESIGTLTMGESAEEHIDAIARRVGELGGTHYIVRVHYGDATYNTSGVATRLGGATLINSSTTVSRDATSVIDVLICGGVGAND